MSHLADRLAAAKAQTADEEAALLEGVAQKLRWIAPAGISARDLWSRLGGLDGQGDVGSLRRRLEALLEQGRAHKDGELWYYGPNKGHPERNLPTGGNVATGPEARRTRILELLAGYPEGLRHGQIVAAIGGSKSTIHNDLMSMQFKGLTKQDHNSVWRLAPPKPSQIDPPAPRTPEPPPPPADPPASTVEIVAEGEVVATLPPPAPEPQAEDDEQDPELDPELEPLSLNDLRESLTAARRLLQVVEVNLEATVGDALGMSLARVGELERELERVRGEARRAREDCASLREEINALHAARAAAIRALGEGT